VHAALAEQVDERRRDACGGARLRHHLSEHRAESDDDGDETESVSDAVLERFDGGAGRHPSRHPEAKRDGYQRDEGMQLEACDEHDERDHRDEREDEEASVRAHADARTMRAATISSGDSLMSHTHACSSGDGSSRVATWLSRRDGGM